MKMIAKTMKLSLVAGALVAATLMVGKANAAPCPTGNFQFTIGSCEEQDKRWTGISTTLPGDWQAQPDNVDVGFGVRLGRDVHFIEFKEFEENVGPGTYSIRGSIEVFTGSRLIDAVLLDSTVFFGGVAVSKNIFLTDDFSSTPLFTLTSTNGSTAQQALIPSKKLWFEDIIVIGPEGGLSTVENAFRQTVPEPTSLSLVALSLLGLGLAARRRR